MRRSIRVLGSARDRGTSLRPWFRRPPQHPHPGSCARSAV